MNPLIRLPLEGTANTRDLGGYPTRDGHATAWQVFLRSDDLHGITAKDMTLLHEYGLTTVLDLRSTIELNDRPNPFAKNPNVLYHHVSLHEAAGQTPPSDLPYDALKHLYKIILEQSKPQIKAAVEILANSRGVTLFHCAAGKDRTGILAALVMGLVNVPNRDIVSNYEVSYTNLRRNAYFKSHAEHHNAMMYSVNDFMEETLVYLREQYGSIEAYLLAIGVSSTDLEALKTKFTYTT
jgi:protein-tyrosine phosphatase